MKHDYLSQWRQFRRALLQRNAALRENAPDSLLEAWDGELAAAGEAVHRHRAGYLADLREVFLAVGSDLLGEVVGLRYQRGWAEGQDLLAALRESREADRTVGYTRTGPQRGDLQFEIADERSRWRASKGQQKLLGAALVLGQCRLVARQADQPVALILDEPAADLDSSRLKALMQSVLTSPAQIFLASITSEGLPLNAPGAMFHVEHGHAKALL